MSARRIKTGALPAGWQLEVWGDSTVWIARPDGLNRERLSDYLDRENAAPATAVIQPLAAHRAGCQCYGCRESQF